jgi:hypothetical protein
MENKGVITMDLLKVGDILEADCIFDSKKKLYLSVKAVHHVYSKPDKNGETKLLTRYLLKMLYVPYILETLVDEDQIGEDYYLSERVLPSGLIQTFIRP